MPHSLILLPDVYESVTRRVATAITEQVARNMRLPPQTLVYLPGNTDAVPLNDGSVFGNCCAPNIHFPSEARLVVRYSEEVDDSTTLTTGINNLENLPLFNDPIRDVVIRPVWRYVTFNLTMEYTAPSIVIAQRWLDEQRARISMGRAEQYSVAEYHYAFPDAVMKLLRIMHKTMEESDYPTGVPFEEWVKQYLTVPTTTIAAIDGTDERLAVVERQVEIIGWPDFTNGPPTPERDGSNTGAYVVTFTYAFRYNRPTHMFTKFPYVVHQKAIPKPLRGETPYPSFRQEPRRVSRTKGAFDRLLLDMQAYRLPYVHYPINDDWTSKDYSKGCLTFFQGLITLSKDDHHSVVDLAEMGTMEFTPFFLEYFYHQGNKLFDRTLSLFDFRLYENNNLLFNHAFEMVPGTTMVRSKTPLDPEKYYHIQIGLVRNWYHLRDATMTCLRRYPTVTWNLLRALGVKHLPNHPREMTFLSANFDRPPSEACPGEGSMLCTGNYPDLAWTAKPEICPDVVRRGILTQKFMSEAITALDKLRDNYVDHRNVGPLNVMYLDILTFSK